MLARSAVVHPTVRCFDRQFATARHGVTRLNAEVKHRILMLIRVYEDRPEAGGAHDIHLDAGPDGAAHEFFQMAYSVTL
jgi:hypothetical protein